MKNCLSKNDLLVSVLIPFHNSANFMDSCLKSIINQTYKNIEIICLDDNSTDDTYNKLIAYQKCYNNIHVFKNDQNKRISYNRNKLISLAKGHYFIFIDSDDELNANAIEKLVASSNSGKTDIVTAKSWVVYTINNVKIKLPFFVISTLWRKSNNFLYVKKNICTSWMHLFKKEMWDKLNAKFLENVDFEDFGLIPYIFLNCNSMTLINDRLYQYKRRKNSLSDFNDKNEMNKIKNILRQINYLLSLFYNNNQLNDKEVLKSINGIIIVAIFAVFYLRKKILKNDKSKKQEIDKMIYQAMEQYKIEIKYSNTWWKSLSYFYDSTMLWFHFKKITLNKKYDLKKERF